MSTETIVAVVFVVILVTMAGAAYSYYLLEQEAKNAEERNNPDTGNGQ